MSQLIPKTLFLLIAGLGAITSLAQSQACASAQDVCGQTDFMALLDTPMDLPGADSLMGVFEAAYTKVVHFHTTFFNSINSDSTQQTVELVVNGLTCDDAVVARLFEANTFEPCNAGDYVAASELWTLAEGAVFSSFRMLENSDYVLILGSESSGCQTDLRLDGLAVSISACCGGSIDVGETAQVEVFGANPELGFEWEPEGFDEAAGADFPLLTYLSPDSTVQFTVTGFIEGCSYTDQVVINVGELSVPNAFTPNNDGSNDTWDIDDLVKFPDAVIEVYDRWGQSVYRSVSYPEPWNGTLRGSGPPVPEGTYYYVINLNDLNVNRPPLVGHVAIIR